MTNGRYRWTMLAALAAVTATTGCDRDAIETFLNHDRRHGHSGQGGGISTGVAGGGGAFAGTGGAFAGTGGAFAGTGGSGGMVSNPPLTCPTISLVNGVFNPCGRANSLAYSPDGQLIAMASDSVVRLWRLSDGALVRDLPGHAYDVAFSPDGSLLAAVGGADAADTNAARIYDVATGDRVRVLPTGSGFYVSTVAFSNDGTLLATAGYMGPIEIWRASDGVRVTAIPYPTSVHNVHFAPSGQRLIVGGVDERATAWDLPAGTPVFTLSPIASEMSDADFSPDGTQVASTGPENDIRIWDATTHALVQSLTGHTNFVSHVVWIDQDHLVSNDWAGGILFWARSGSGQLAAASARSIGTQSLGIAVSPDRHTLAVGASDSSGGQSGGLIFFPL